MARKQFHGDYLTVEMGPQLSIDFRAADLLLRFCEVGRVTNEFGVARFRFATMVLPTVNFFHAYYQGALGKRP